jgi:DNA-directed RNA polymerase specialized sigma24 family protein
LTWPGASTGRRGSGPTTTAGPGGDSRQPGPDEPADASHEPSSLAQWGELHEQIAALPDEEREVVGLLFYQGLSQPEAAALLATSVRTVQRRWHTALCKLHRVWDRG